MTISFTIAVSDALLTIYGANLNTTGILAVFSGPPPTNADTALSGNAILAAATFSGTAFGTAAAHSIAANALTGQNAYISGTATFFRTMYQGGSIAATAMVANGVYVINAAAGTTWTTYGAPNNTAGTVFVATGPGTGTGTCFPATIVEQGTVGTSGADLNLNTTTIASGGPISITSFTRSL